MVAGSCRLVFICSPFWADDKLAVADNCLFAAKVARKAADAGFLPMVPHLYFPQFFDEGRRGRRRGLEFARVWLRLCDEVWVVGDRITAGMRGEVEEALKLGLRVRFFDEDFCVEEEF